MKKIAFFIIAALFCTSAFAQDQTQTLQIKITLLGTSHREDVQIMTSNLSKLAGMINFAPTVIAKKHFEFAGTYSGDPSDLIADVKSLASDRFSVDSKKKGDTLTMTLRKIEYQSPATPAE